MARKWSRRDDITRCLRARRAERAVVYWLQSGGWPGVSGPDVTDVAQQQLSSPSGGLWQIADIAVSADVLSRSPYLIDVKNSTVNCDGSRAFPSAFVKPEKGTLSRDVVYLSTRTIGRDWDSPDTILVEGVVSGASLAELSASLKEILPAVSFRLSGDWALSSGRLPLYLFDMAPSWYAPIRRFERFHRSVASYYSSPDECVPPSVVPGLAPLRREGRLTRPIAILLLLAGFFSQQPARRPAWIATVAREIRGGWPPSLDWPWGLHDPGREVDRLRSVLSTVGDEPLLPPESSRDFCLSRSGNVRVSTPAGQRTLLAYCHECGLAPLIIGRENPCPCGVAVVCSQPTCRRCFRGCTHPDRPSASLSSSSAFDPQSLPAPRRSRAYSVLDDTHVISSYRSR